MVEIGPVTAAAKVGATQMIGFFTIFPIWSIEVPRPCDTTPPHPFSRKLTVAKPTICAQHPATQAPPAKRKPSEVPFAKATSKAEAEKIMAQMAALEMGRVKMIPMTTETTIPMRSGWKVVAQEMKSPR